MTRVEKLVDEFRNCAGAFPYRDLVKVLAYYGYDRIENGDGSRRRFVNPTTKRIIRLHEPHPGNEAKAYVVRQVREHLEEMGLL